ncbi:hypothetical protein [Haliangium sp.]|uniref:hypothetical protein n=1 Tax=Haliangium sp. TaxID=2663208 RepID=UPI003D11EF40
MSACDVSAPLEGDAPLFDQRDQRDQINLIDQIDQVDQVDQVDQAVVSLSLLQQRSDAIRAVHAGHPLINNPLIFAGIAYTETQMAHCYSEYYNQVSTLVCAGPSSSDCGGGAVTAGYWDGPCWEQDGGLGMWQFDEGSHSQTLSKWSTSGYWNNQPHNVLDLEDSIAAAIDFVLFKAWWSDRTPFFPNTQAMYDWINGIRPINGNSDWELWLGFLAYNYNGEAWGTGDWLEVKEKYRDHTLSIYTQLGGDSYWYGGGSPPPPPSQSCSPEGGLWCGGNGVAGDPNMLYVCKNGALVVKEVCANGCYRASAGSPDACYTPNSADLGCTCYSGKYHNGDNIPPSLTYCGMRVCGMDGNVYECRTSNQWEQTGLTCGSGACSCPFGAHLDGTPIATQHTECHFQVCGGGNTWYTCESGGWQSVSGSYCTM